MFRGRLGPLTAIDPDNKSAEEQHFVGVGDFRAPH